MPVDLTLRRPDGVDLDIRAPAGQTLGAALDGLGLGVDHQECWSGSRRLTGADRIGGLGLRSGDVVSTGQARPRIGGRESM
ncbi:MAG: hypothetical protein JWN20_1383, partial [Jatrophihabitantaceae bacterium]|nr:hypothetical protein [Jatrophihabitantaceae bacterium]